MNFCLMSVTSLPNKMLQKQCQKNERQKRRRESTKLKTNKSEERLNANGISIHYNVVCKLN